MADEGEVRWEAFNALTYGSTGLSYFTYWTPGANHSEPWSYHNGIILSDGTRGEKYEIVKRINRELQVLYRGLVDPLPGESMAPGDIRSEAVFHVGAETDETVKPFAGHKHIRTLDGGLLYGRLLRRRTHDGHEQRITMHRRHCASRPIPRLSV